MSSPWLALLGRSGKGWPLLAAGALSGALYTLSIPAFNFGEIAWICLVPALLAGLSPAVRAAGPYRVCLVGLACGLAAGIGRVYWVSETLINYGGLNQAQAVATTSALILYIALYPVFFFWISRSLPVSSPFFSWLAASVWVILDWAQSWIITGFPWQQIGYSQHLNLGVLQFASVAGVYGLSFALVLANSAIAQALIVRRRIVLNTGPVAVAILGIFVFGFQRLVSLEQEQPKFARVAIIQGNISQDIKWKINRIDRTTNHYVHLTRSIAELETEPFDLILFPETALPFYLNDPYYAKQKERVAQVARDIRTPILVGSLEGRIGVHGHPIYNRAFLFDENGTVLDYADKVHLVPFGEYLPMPWFFSYLEELTAESGQFTHGLSHRVVDVPQTDLRLGVFICYESIFPAIARTLAASGATLLVNTTNDAWFGHTSAPYQHIAMAAVRAVECGLPLVRAANTGISGAVSPAGRVLSATEIFETTVVNVEVPPPTTPTLYVRYGDILLILCGVGLSIAAVVARRDHFLAITEAREMLARFARDPRPLVRPLVLLHGYCSEGKSWDPILDRLGTCFNNLDTHLVCPDLNSDRTIAEFGSLLPTVEADYIGHSLGGLVALQRAHHVRTSRVFALASPFRGTWVATVARWLKKPFPRLLADLTPGSSYLCSLPLDVCAQISVVSFRLNGDPVVSSDSASIDGWEHREYSGGWKLWPPSRHRDVIADPRVIRDIVAALRQPPPSNA